MPICFNSHAIELKTGLAFGLAVFGVTHSI